MTDEEIREAREELGRTLEELKAGLDEAFATARARLDEKDHRPVEEDTVVTPDVGGALWSYSAHCRVWSAAACRVRRRALDAPAKRWRGWTVGCGRRGWTSMTT